MKIAIDGPAGAGKSTIARLVAKRMHAVYVDTGAMYRAMGLAVLRMGIRPEDGEAVGRAAEETSVSIVYRDGCQHVLLNGEDVTEHLRGEAVGNAASAISVYPAVRTRLVALQRELAAGQDVVMDGRDIGTDVLPDAEVKVFLTASARTRAVRRYLQERQAEGAEPETESDEARNEIARIEKDIEERDRRDTSRAESPLRKASDAVLIDSSEMTVGDVTEKILGLAGKAAAL